MSEEMLNDQRKHIDDIHALGPGHALAARVIEAAEQGDAIARDVLRDAVDLDPAAQARARAGLDIIKNEALGGGKVGGKIVGHTVRVDGSSDAEKKAKALENLKRWIAAHEGR
jgi:hypothetical protein